MINVKEKDQEDLKKQKKQVFKNAVLNIGSILLGIAASILIGGIGLGKRKKS